MTANTGPRRPVLGTRRSLYIAAVLVLLTVAGLVLLPIDDTDPGPQPNAVPVSMVEFAFVPDAIETTRGQPLTIRNNGAEHHSLLVVGLAKGVELAPGQTATLELPPDVTGQFEVICDLPGHREAGMIGSLTVVETSLEPESSPDPG